jgi:hypothetical protein
MESGDSKHNGDDCDSVSFLNCNAVEGEKKTEFES